MTRYNQWELQRYEYTVFRYIGRFDSREENDLNLNDCLIESAVFLKSDERDTLNYFLIAFRITNFLLLATVKQLPKSRFSFTW